MVVSTCIEVNILWLGNITTMDSHNGVYSSGKENHVMDSQRGIYSSLQWTGIKLNILQLKNIIYEEKKRRVESD